MRQFGCGAQAGGWDAEWEQKFSQFLKPEEIAQLKAMAQQNNATDEALQQIYDQIAAERGGAAGQGAPGWNESWFNKFRSLGMPEEMEARFARRALAGETLGLSLFTLAPPKVRVEMRAKGRCLSLPVSASYGFEDATGEVHLKVMATDARMIEPNTVTVVLMEEIVEKTVGVSLLDATSGVELARLDKIAVAIAL